MILILVLLLLSLGFLWLDLPVKNWLVTSSVVFLLLLLSGIGNAFFTIVLLVIFAALSAMLYFLPDLRRKHVSRRLMAFVRGTMPPISRTEQEAIDAGTGGGTPSYFRVSRIGHNC